MPETERERLARYIYEMARLFIPGDTPPAKLDALRNRLANTSVEVLCEISNVPIPVLIGHLYLSRPLPVDL